MPVIKFPDGGARVSIFLQSIGNAFIKHLFGDKGANLLGEKATEQVLKRSKGKQVKRAERVKSTFCSFELKEASASLD